MQAMKYQQNSFTLQHRKLEELKINDKFLLLNNYLFCWNKFMMKNGLR